MRNKTIYTILILMLLAVGVNAQGSYQTAKEKVKIGGKNISVKSEIYVNLMPQVIGDNPNEKIDCSKNGLLIAPITIESVNNSKLPKGIEITRLWIKNNGVWSQIKFNKDETNAKETSIYAVARDCPNEKFNADKEIIAVVEVKYKGKSYFVLSNQTKVQKAY